MFDELDDPTPDLRPAQVLPAVQARGRVLRRRRRLAAAGGAGTALALVAALVLALPTGGEGSTDSLFATPPSAPATSAPSSPPTATPTTAPSPTAPVPAGPTSVPVPPSPEPTGEPAATAPAVTPPPSQEPPEPPQPSRPAPAGEVELRGDDLAVTQVGAPRAQAVAAVTAALGAPSEDPSSLTRCPASMREVAWPELTLAFDEQDRLAGWTTQSPSLRTPSGVAVGTTVARLREVYGDRLQLFPPNPDHGDTYGVEGVSMSGGLSGPADTDRVLSLSNGFCTGP